MQTLNERVIVLIHDLNEQFSNYAEMPQIREHMKRVSKFVHIKSLKLFDDENTISK